MHIEIDQDKCLRYGQCVLEAPEVFELGEEGPAKVRPDASDDFADQAMVAADLCPMQAIEVEL